MPNSGPRYFPALDGLRALAFLGVLIYHLQLPFSGLGWAGVNLFFVISGFLIGGILLDTKSKPFYFRNFYVRRALRIFPIYYLTLIFIVVVGVVTHVNLSLAPFYFVYLQSYTFYFPTGFPYYFGHTWTLAIEEQFYLLFPAVVLWLSRRSLVVVLCGCLFIAPVVRVIYPFALLAQVDALALGALLALVQRAPQIPLKWVHRVTLGVLGITLPACLIVGALTNVSSSNDLLILPLVYLSGSLVSLFTLFNTPAGLLVAPSLRYIGKISYGLYLYHLPVLHLVGRLASVLVPTPYSPPVQVMVWFIEAGLTFAVAALSWHFIESPILSLKDRFTKRDAPISQTTVKTAY